MSNLTHTEKLIIANFLTSIQDNMVWDEEYKYWKADCNFDLSDKGSKKLQKIKNKLLFQKEKRLPMETSSKVLVTKFKIAEIK